MGVAGLLIGPYPLRVRAGIMMAAAVIAGAAIVLHLILYGAARGGMLETVFYLAAFVALYMLVFRLVHPALVRRANRYLPPGAALASVPPGLRGYVEWYLSDPQR